MFISTKAEVSTVKLLGKETPPKCMVEALRPYSWDHVEYAWYCHSILWRAIILFRFNVLIRFGDCILSCCLV